MEFASMAIELGSEVTVIHHNDRALKMYPSQYVDIVVNKMKDEGVKFDFNESVSKIEKQGEEYIVTYESGKTLTVDYVLEATGREANVDAAKKDTEHYDVLTVPYGKTMLFQAKNEVYADFSFVFDKEHNLVGAAFISDET